MCIVNMVLLSIIMTVARINMRILQDLIAGISFVLGIRKRMSMVLSVWSFAPLSPICVWPRFPQGFKHMSTCQLCVCTYTWVVVKMMVPFWVP